MKNDCQLCHKLTNEIENNKNLSNKEKIIMKRKKYEKYLDQNQEK